MRQFEHIPVKTVRFWAWLDTAVTWMPAIPPLSMYFVGGLYWMNGLLGGTSEAPAFEAIHLMFVSLMGSLVTLWCVVRILYAQSWMAVVDGWGRLWIGATLVWIVLAMDGPPILWMFVFTEWIGAFAQLRAAYFPRAA
ncbi:MAG: hypothetical protein V4650_14270 [Pseudomonadota bacterium]